MAAAAAKPPTKAASSPPSSRSRAGSSLGCTSRSAAATRAAKAPGACIALAVGAAIDMRGGGEIGRADVLPVDFAADQVFDARAVGARRGAEDARKSGAPLPFAARRAAASGFSSPVSSRAATALTAASSSAICAGNRSRNRPEIRQVTSTRGRPIAAQGSTSTPVHAAGGMIPSRPAAHQREPLRDLLAAGAQRRAAPEVDHQRARHLAVSLHVAADDFVGGEPAEIHRGRRRQGARIGGEHDCGRSASRPAARGAASRRDRARCGGRRARRAGRGVRCPRWPAEPGRPHRRGARP